VWKKKREEKEESQGVEKGEEPWSDDPLWDTEAARHYWGGWESGQ